MQAPISFLAETWRLAQERWTEASVWTTPFHLKEASTQEMCSWTRSITTIYSLQTATPSTDSLPVLEIPQGKILLILLVILHNCKKRGLINKHGRAWSGNHTTYLWRAIFHWRSEVQSSEIHRPFFQALCYTLPLHNTTEAQNIQIQPKAEEALKFPTVLYLSRTPFLYVNNVPQTD